MGIKHSSDLSIPLPLITIPKTQWWNTCEQCKPVFGLRLSVLTFDSKQEAQQPNVCLWYRAERIFIFVKFVLNIAAKIRGDRKNEMPALWVITQSLGSKTFPLLYGLNPGTIGRSLGSCRARGLASPTEPGSCEAVPLNIQSGKLLVASTGCMSSAVAFYGWGTTSNPKKQSHVPKVTRLGFWIQFSSI